MESQTKEQPPKETDDTSIPEWKTYVVMYDIQDSKDPKLKRLLKKYSIDMIENINGCKTPRSVGNFVLIDRECIDPDNTRSAEKKADILSKIIENDRRTQMGEEELLPYEDPPETPADQKKKKGKSAAVSPAKSKTSKKGKEDTKSPPKSPKMNRKSKSKSPGDKPPEAENIETQEEENKTEIKEENVEEDDVQFPYNEVEDKSYLADRIYILTNYPQNEEEYNELIKQHLLQAIFYLTEPRRTVNAAIVPQSIPMIQVDEFDFNMNEKNLIKTIKKNDNNNNFVNTTQEIPIINTQLDQKDDTIEEEKTEEELKAEEEERIKKEEEERIRKEQEEEERRKKEEEEKENSKKRKSVAKEKKGKTKEIETPEIDIAEEMRKKIGIYVQPTKITPSYMLSTIIKCYYENISNEDYRNMIFLQFPIDKALELLNQQQHMMKLICHSAMQYYKYQKWRFELPMFLSAADVVNHQTANNENQTDAAKQEEKEEKKDDSKTKKEKGKKVKKEKDEPVEEEKPPEVVEEKKEDEDGKKKVEEEKLLENILETRVYKIYQDYNSRIKFHYNDLITLLITMIDSVAYECIDKAMDLQLHPLPVEVEEEEKPTEEEERKLAEEEAKKTEEEAAASEAEEEDSKKGKKGNKKIPTKAPAKEKKRESKIKTTTKKGKKGSAEDEEENKEEEKPQIPVIRAPPPLEPAKPVPPLPPETQMWKTPDQILKSYSQLKPDESVINLLSNDHIEYNQKSKTIYERNEILKQVIECNLDVRENGLNYYNLYGNNYLEKITKIIDSLPIPGFSLENFPPEDVRIDREKLNIYFTKLHYYSYYPISELRMNDLILHFEEYINIIDPNVKEEWKFNNRRYVEYLDEQCLKQAMNELYKHPLSIYLKYLPQYDILLLLNHYSTPHSRYTVIKDTTLPFDDSHLPTFQQYYNYILENSNGNEEAILPIKSHIVTQTGEDLPVDPEFQQLHEHKFIFPSDHSLIEFQPKRINVFYYNYNFGLKAISNKTMEHIISKEEPKYETLSSFYMNFNEGSSLYYQAGYPMPEKNDGYDSILMTYNEMNGNEYDIYSNGIINITSIRGKYELNEYCRQWCGSGDMIVYYYYKEPEVEGGEGENNEENNDNKKESNDDNKEENKEIDNENNEEVSSEEKQKLEEEKKQRLEEKEKEKNKLKYSKMIYHYDGSITIDDPLQELTVYESGEQYLIVKATGEEGEIDPIEVFEYDDDDNNCKIIARRNLFGESLSIEYRNDNIVRTIYHDGTNIFFDKKKDVKYYYHPLYGTVLLFNDHNEVCLKHQNGIKCPMNLSGINPRYKCYTLDGTLLTMNYDTRVISKYNGILECLRYDKTLIKGNDGGVIEVIYGKNNKQFYDNNNNNNNNNNEEDVPPSAREQSDPTIGNYIFNFNEGFMDFHDPEYNHYHVDYNGEHIVELTGILNGCVTETWIDNPLQPQLFILKRDGNGYEILRNNDMEEYKRCVEYHTNCEKRVDNDVCIESGEIGKNKTITYEWEIGVDRDELYEVYSKCKLPIKIRYYENMRIDHPFTYKIYRTFYEINPFDENERNHLKDIINEYREHMKKIENDYIKYTVDIPEEMDENKTNEISLKILAARKKRVKHLRHEEKRREKEEKLKLKNERKSMLEQKAKEEYQEKIRRSQIWTSPLQSQDGSRNLNDNNNNEVIKEEEEEEGEYISKENSLILLLDGKNKRVTNCDNNYWKSGVSPSVDSLPSEERFKNNNEEDNNNNRKKNENKQPFDGTVMKGNGNSSEKEDSSSDEEEEDNRVIPSVTSSSLSSSGRNLRNNLNHPERINSSDELNELRTHSSRRIKDRLVNGEIQEISDFIFDKYEINFGKISCNSIINDKFIAQNVGYLSYRLRVDHPKQFSNHKKDENYITWSLDSTKASPGMKIHLKVKLVANSVGSFNDYVEVVTTHSRFHLIIKAEIV